MAKRNRRMIGATFSRGAGNRQEFPDSVNAIDRVCRALHSMAQHFNNQKLGLDLRFFLRTKEEEEIPSKFDDLDKEYLQDHLDQSWECGWELYRQVGEDLNIILNIDLFLDNNDRKKVILRLRFIEKQNDSKIQEFIFSSRKREGIPHQKLAEAVREGICSAIMGTDATTHLQRVREVLVGEFHRVYTQKLGLASVQGSVGNVDSKGIFLSP